MSTPQRPTRIPQGTPEKVEKKPTVVVVGPHPVCSAFIPEDYVERCGRLADVHAQAVPPRAVEALVRRQREHQRARRGGASAGVNERHPAVFFFVFLVFYEA